MSKLQYILGVVLFSATVTFASNLVVEPSSAKIIDSINQAVKAQKINKQLIGKIMVWSALKFLNEPYVGHLLDKKQPEYLYVGLDKTDCMLFIEQIVALSELIKHNTLNLDNYTQKIEKLRYHGDLAYCNRNHYFKDWALVNINNGFVTDQAWQLTHINYPYPLDVISQMLSHKTDSPNHQYLACIKDREQQVDKEQLGFIPISLLPKYLDKIKDGDIIGIVRTPGRADGVYHLGIAYIKDGKLGMIHASSDKKKVVIAPSLMDYLKQFDNSEGIILLRVKPTY